MAIHKHDDRWRSEIVQTEIQSTPEGLSQPLHFVSTPNEVGARTAVAKKITNALLTKAHAFFARQPPTTWTVSCVGPAEAYLHA